MPRSTKAGPSAQGFSPTDALGFHNMSAGLTSSSISSDDAYSTGDALMARCFIHIRVNIWQPYRFAGMVIRPIYGKPEGIFSGFTFGWVFTEESFMPKGILTYGKLRLILRRKWQP